MTALISVAIVLVAFLAVAYVRAPLWFSSLLVLLGTAFAVFARGASPVWLGVVVVVLAVLNLKPLRRA